MTKPYLEEFFVNCARIKAEVESNPTLMERIQTSLTQIDSRFDSGYEVIDPNHLGLKWRKNYFGVTELGITGDIYQPNLPVSPFAVVVKTESAGEFTAYLVQDFHQLRELHRTDFKSEPTLLEQWRALKEKLKEKDYELGQYQDTMPFGLITKRDVKRVVIHDLDPKPFLEFMSLIRSSMDGEERYPNLRKIYNYLCQPEYKLQI